MAARVRAPIWRKSGILLVHVPRSAGTSLSMQLYGRLTGHMNAAEIRRACPDVFRELPKLAVVRNPWDRAVSSYGFAKTRKIAGLYPGVSDADLRDYFVTFETFVERWLVRQNINRADYVYQPQWTFLSDTRHKYLPIVDFVGRYENLPGVEKFISEKTGREFRLPHMNESARLEDFRRYYTPQLINAVAEVYAADIEYFGYRFE
jgi:hypothetical protein